MEERMWQKRKKSGLEGTLSLAGTSDGGHGPQDRNSDSLWRYWPVLSISWWGSSGKILFFSLSWFLHRIPGLRKPLRFIGFSYLPPSRPHWNASRKHWVFPGPNSSSLPSSFLLYPIPSLAIKTWISLKQFCCFFVCLFVFKCGSRLLGLIMMWILRAMTSFFLGGVGGK